MTVAAASASTINNPVRTLTENNEEFLIPSLSAASVAPTDTQLAQGVRFPHGLHGRAAQYPSLSREFLTMYAGAGAQSSRFSAVWADMQEVLKIDPFAKFVIFSQALESLETMAQWFEYMSAAAAEGTAVARPVVVSAKCNAAMQVTRLKAFNEDPLCNVCLLPTGFASAGLTLTVAYTCYILEPLHRVSEEAQALSRVHRIGQTRTVRCVVFYIRDSCEERLLALRERYGVLKEHLRINATSGYEPTNVDEEEPETGGKSMSRGGKARAGATGAEVERLDEDAAGAAVSNSHDRTGDRTLFQRRQRKADVSSLCSGNFTLNQLKVLLGFGLQGDA